MNVSSFLKEKIVKTFLPAYKESYIQETINKKKTYKVFNFICNGMEGTFCYILIMCIVCMCMCTYQYITIENSSIDEYIKVDIFRNMRYG